MIVQEGRGFLERPQPDEITKVIPGFSTNPRIPYRST